MRSRRSWRRDDWLSGRMAVPEMDVGNMGGRKAGVGLARWGGRGEQGIWGCLGECELAQLEDQWGLCSATTGLWPACS